MAVYVADEQSRPIDIQRLRRLATYVMRQQHVPEAMELSVLCIDADAIAQLNAHHMGNEGPTDVLAFPMDMPGETPPNEPPILGDVVLCPQVAAEQAEERAKSVDEELDLLLVHGILHLLGYDHADEAARREMFGRTDQLLAGFQAERGDEAAGSDER